MSAAASVTIDPTGALERLGAELPNLLDARARTREAVAARREALAGLPLDPQASGGLFRSGGGGEGGRGERTRRSDDDWALLVDGAERGGIGPEPTELASTLGGDGARGP